MQKYAIGAAMGGVGVQNKIPICKKKHVKVCNRGNNGRGWDALQNKVPICT